MKKLLTLLLLFTALANAQIVTIPDANFKARLISANNTDTFVAKDQIGNFVILDTNDDGQVQVSEAQAIYTLYLQNSSITDLTGLEAFTNLMSLVVNGNNLTNIPLSPLTNLRALDCDNTPITTLDFTGLPHFWNLICRNTPITTLDLSGNPEFNFLFCQNSPNLTYINLKNGNPTINANVDWSNCPNLAFICVDDGETALVQDIVNSNDLTNTVVNSYCSYVPGGAFNTITGTITYDADNNGCDGSDPVYPHIRVDLADTETFLGASFTNTSGNYTHYTGAGVFNVTPVIDNPSWFAISPTSAAVTFPDVSNNTQVQNFCISAVGNHQDVEVIIAANTNVRIGSDNRYHLIFKNNGNTAVEGDITFSFDDSVLDFVSASIPALDTGTGTLIWSYTNLLPFETRDIEIVFNANSQIETPPLNIGNIIDFDAAISPSPDEIPANNTSHLKQTAVASLDPNTKTCLEGNLVSVSKIGEYLHYFIEFENTGTSIAQNIVVKDTLDMEKYDIASMRVLNSSHPVTSRLTGNIAEFIFQGINLGIGGHGNILLKVRSDENLVEGDYVQNLGNIYFDYDFPVATNYEFTYFEDLSVDDPNYDASVSIYPNPAKHSINIKAATAIKLIQLYDVQGRLLQTKMLNGTEAVLDISDKSNGIYFLRINTDKGIKTEKIVKN